MLICPKCKQKIVKFDNTYKCVNNHSYDISKNGYINLLLSRNNSGDCKEMVIARSIFLPKGYYDIIPNKIIDILSSYNISTNSYILDGGCGTGYYDSIIKKLYPNIIGCDISKDAIVKASKMNNDLLYFVASSNSVPLESESISVILNIFAPTFDKEASRLLNDNGLLIIVAPDVYHLIELKNLLYKNLYPNNPTPSIFNNFDLINTFDVSKNQNLSKDDLVNITKMTPYFYKSTFDSLNNLENIEELNTTIAFKIYVYKKNKSL